MQGDPDSPLLPRGLRALLCLSDQYPWSQDSVTSLEYKQGAEAQRILPEGAWRAGKEGIKLGFLRLELVLLSVLCAAFAALLSLLSQLVGTARTHQLC